jgi:SlyX protein
MTFEERIVELEIRYTHQSDTIEQLSAVVRLQERAIEALRAELKALRSRQDAAAEAALAAKPPHEPPPHY